MLSKSGGSRKRLFTTLLILLLIQTFLTIVSGGALWITSAVVVVAAIVAIVALMLRGGETKMYCSECKGDRRIVKVTNHSYYGVIVYELKCGHKVMGAQEREYFKGLEHL